MHDTSQLHLCRSMPQPDDDLDDIERTINDFVVDNKVGRAMQM